MRRILDMRLPALFFAAIFAVAFLLGCASKSASQEADAAGAPASGAGPFVLPKSKVDYAAAYAVDEGSGVSAQKKIWRKGDRMRIDVSSDAGSSISLYFVSGKAYSCANLGSGYSCYEITGGLDPQAAAQLSDEPDFSSAEAAEEVDIGNARGSCFLFPYKVFEKRKQCFTDRGVLAFDQYSVASGRSHTEYLTNLVYGAYDADFVLPSEPKAAPAAPEN